MLYYNAILQYDDSPYSPPDPRQLRDACAHGDIGLNGQNLLAARLDMALAGLMRELGKEFFDDDLFANRYAAAREIMAAARVVLADAAEEPVRLLLAEAEAVLAEWALLLPDTQAGQTMLYAAEEPAPLL